MIVALTSQPHNKQSLTVEIVNDWRPEEMEKFLKPFKSKAYRIHVLIHEGVSIAELMEWFNCSRDYIAGCRTDKRESWNRRNKKARAKRFFGTAA